MINSYEILYSQLSFSILQFLSSSTPHYTIAIIFVTNFFPHHPFSRIKIARSLLSLHHPSIHTVTYDIILFILPHFHSHRAMFIYNSWYFFFFLPPTNPLFPHILSPQHTESRYSFSNSQGVVHSLPLYLYIH